MVLIGLLATLNGTWRTMFVAFLGLARKVYACGMLAGVAISTTKVGEFLSAMARLHIPKKLTIPIAVMLRYLPTIREDWHFIKDAMGLRDVSPTLMVRLAALVQRLAGMGKILFIVTHDYEFVCRTCTRVLHSTHDQLMAQEGIYRHFISGREQAVGWKL